MFQFLMGVAFGAAGYWAWQSFGRDLVGMGSDQETTYGGFSGGSTASSFGSPSTGSGSTSGSGSGSGSTSSGGESNPTTSAGGSTGSTGSAGSTA